MWSNRGANLLLGVLGVTLVVVLVPDLVWAQATPWETPLNTILTSMTGPVARILGVLAIVIFGLGMAFSDGGGLRTALGILFGLSIAFSAATWGLTFLGYTGA